MATFNQQPQQQPMQQGPTGGHGGYSVATQNYIQGLQFQGKTTLPKWQTRLGQCEAPVTTGDWFFALCCIPCAQATAKSEFDGSHPCFNCMCFSHIGTFSWIRRGYNLHGTCGDDCCCGLICAPCTARQALNEARIQHKNGTNPPLYHGGPTDWQESLFGCGCCDLCKACLCPGSVVHETRRLLQPVDGKLQQDSCCFDCLCLSPTSMYGQVRHMYGIQNEFGLCEDMCLPLICFPCALSRANRETKYRDAEIKKFLRAQGR